MYNTGTHSAHSGTAPKIVVRAPHRSLSRRYLVACRQLRNVSGIWSALTSILTHAESGVGKTCLVNRFVLDIIIIGERKRANLVAILYVTVRRRANRTSPNCACHRTSSSEPYRRTVARRRANYIVVERYVAHPSVGSTPLIICERVRKGKELWIGLEKVPFVVDERGKVNVVPVRLLSREKLGFLNADCVIGNGQGNAGQQKQRRKGKRD